MRNGRVRLGTVLLTLGSLLPALVPPADAQAEAKTRRYYLAAEGVQWDYAPGKSRLHGARHTGRIPAPWTHNTRRRKVCYIEYTDHTFTTCKPQPDWPGILGPEIRLFMIFNENRRRTKRPSAASCMPSTATSSAICPASP